MLKQPKSSFKTQAFYGSFILLECLFWGAGNPFIKLGMENAPPFFFLFWRYLIASVLFLLLFRGKAFAPLNRKNVGSCLAIGVLVAGTFLISSFSLKLTSATTAGFLMGISVVFTPFLSRLVLGTRIQKSMIAVIAMVVAGMYMLSAQGGAFHFGLGEALALLCSLMFAAALVFTSKYVNGVGPATMSTIQALSACVLALVCSLIFEGPQSPAVISPAGWLMLAYLGVFSTFLAFLLQNVALKHVSAVLSSLGFCTEPVFTAIAAYIVLGERLTTVGLLGAVIITVGTLLASFVQHKGAQRAEG